MIFFKIDFVEIRDYLLLEVLIKLIGKSITPKGLVIHHGVDCLFKVSEGKKLLTESTLLNC